MQQAADGAPLLGPSARTLGARPQIDLPADTQGMVRPGTGGLSVSPNDLMGLPTHRRPPEFGGTGKDPVWYIDTLDVGTSLTYRLDPANQVSHAFLEPAFPMPLGEYQDALAATRRAWRLASP